jgi:AraC family transcriptional regulator
MACMHDDFGRALTVVRCACVGGVDLTEYRADPGLHLAEHAHHRPTFNFMLSGTQIEDSWSGRRRLDCGVTVFAPRALAHTINMSAEGNRVLHVELEPAWLAEMDEVLRIPDRVVVDERGALAPAMAHLLRELRDPDAVSPLAVETAALAALEALSETAADERRQRPAWLARVERRLAESLGDPPTLAGLAAEAGVHPVHVSRSFRRVHGETLTGWVRRKRVAHACKAITQRRAGFAELALELGFADQSHFNRVFRSVTRMTPGQYAAAVR